MKRTEERAEFLASVLTTAVEGGINYWAQVGDYRWGYPDLGHSDGRPWADGDEPYANVSVYDEDEGLNGVPVDVETISRGLGLLRSGEQKYVSESIRKRIRLADRENDAGEIDAGDADVILQLGLFGEVIYG